MHLITTRRAAVALIAVGLAVLASPAEAKRIKPPSLTSDTTIATSTSGWIDVALRDDAELSPKITKNPDVAVAGVGRLVTLEITSLNTGYQDTDTLQVYRWPAWMGGATAVYGTYDGKQVCTPFPVRQLPVLDSCSKAHERILLHEGYYRITVLADNAPIEIHLALDGLDEGTTVIHPTHPLASAERDLPLLEGVPDHLVSFGGTAHAPKAQPAYLLTDLKRSGNTGVFEDGQCVRQDGILPAPPGAYLPHCPGGNGSAWFQASVEGSGTGYAYGAPVIAYPPGPGDIGIGGSFGDSLGLTLKHALGVWLEPTPA